MALELLRNRCLSQQSFRQKVDKTLKIIYLSIGVLTIGLVLFLSGCAGANYSAGIAVGAAPICPYGYYEVPPYACAPDGYYGPEWFSGGVFIGAGPWYRGPRSFYGHVDHNLDIRHGYRGPTPGRGEPPAQQRVPFRGQAMHDSRGREAPRGRK